MGDMLSQEEINALLKGMDEEEAAIEEESSSGGLNLSDQDIDAIGEVSNISMGTAATTLFALINQKVTITTPTVTVETWDGIKDAYSDPCVAIQIVYTEGLAGTNMLILKEDDVKVITDLMMGGDGTNPDVELSELHLSAISEAMNQMIGSAATSMSSMFNKKIDIAPPNSNHLNLQESFDQTELADFLGSDFIKVSFRLQIGDLVDSEMMQLYPMEFADDIMNNFANVKEKEVEEEVAAAPATAPASQPEMPAQPPQLNQQMNQGMGMPQQPAAMDMNYQQPNMGMQQHPNMGMQQPNAGMQQPNMGMQQPNMGMQQPPNMGMPQQNMGNMMPPNQGMVDYNNQFRNVEVQQAQFQNFDMSSFVQQKENIDLIMDVPLEVTVELGRTHRSIKDILEFAPGTIIELNKLAGEPIDVLVNGKVVAKGEVVVIAENFSIRLTEIVKDSTAVL